MPTDDQPVDEPADDLEAVAFDAPGDPADGLSGLLGGLGGADGGGGFDLGGLLASAMDMQQQLVAAQEQMASTVVTGRSGGGAVEIDLTGGMAFLAVRIAPEAVDPDDVEMLQDLVLAALHDAGRAVAELQQAATPALPGLGDLGLDLGLGAGDEDDDEDDEDEDDDEDGA